MHKSRDVLRLQYGLGQSYRQIETIISQHGRLLDYAGPAVDVTDRRTGDVMRRGCPSGCGIR